MHVLIKLINFAHYLKGVKVGHEAVHFNNVNTFTRLLLLEERTGKLQHHFSYGLTPLPNSLFKYGFNRKADKAALATILTQNV